ncbi:hypothetical protein RhiirA4_475401 [Rhizophagus irregularis]|uniref:Uncharacterized protein n=1 Tax=Rhizophagus irregularis TaxID=588596 RepID=A0A2I1GXX3_9GLOM|nr:hypothetical protein RhiirA4_468536 [Rhizophagus irregularis]PKY55736.1 hypothetical protein RhiirA4_475401 [Rhizophagus irregularis]
MSPNWPTFKSNIDSNINYIMIIFKITKNFFHQNAYYTYMLTLYSLSNNWWDANFEGNIISKSNSWKVLKKLDLEKFINNPDYMIIYDYIEKYGGHFAKIVRRLLIPGLVSKNLEIQKTVFLVGDSFGFLKHEFDGFLSGGRSNLWTRDSVGSLDTDLGEKLTLMKLAPAWKPKSQASNASLDGFIWDVNFSID